MDWRDVAKVHQQEKLKSFYGSSIKHKNNFNL